VLATIVHDIDPTVIIQNSNSHQITIQTTTNIPSPPPQIGGTAEQVGGVFASDGAVGKHFTDSGAVGGSVQQELGGKQENNTINGGV